MDKHLNDLIKKNKKSNEFINSDDYATSNKDKKGLKKSDNEPIFLANSLQKSSLQRNIKSNEKSKEKLFFESQLKIKGRTKKEIKSNFIKGLTNIMAYKYSSTEKLYNGTVIDSLVCNKNCHTVAVFKDFMIIDYIDEFLKRY